MKAIVCDRYGAPDVLQITQKKIPIPKDNEVRVKIVAFPITTEDPMQRMGKPYFTRLFLGLNKPNSSILGAEFSGIIESIGKNVTSFKVGDEVYGHSGMKLGCYAEYMCMSETGMILKKPSNLSFQEAAPICTSMASWNFLKNMTNVTYKQKILINGASGSVGSIAVQLSKLAGAEITGVCSTENLDKVKAMGANKVIDYTKEDFTGNSEKYDIIFDVAGKISFAKSKGSLKENGIYLCAVLKFSILVQMYWTKLFNKKKVYFSATGLQPLKKRMSFFKELNKLFEKGELSVPVERIFAFDQIVDAHNYVENEKKAGNVIVKIA